MVYVDNYYANLAKRVNTQLESQESLKKTFEPPKEKKMSLSKLEERLKLGDQAFFKAIYSDLDKEVQSYNVAFKASKLRSLLHGHNLEAYPNVRDQMEGLLLSVEGVARHLEDRKFDRPRVNFKSYSTQKQNPTIANNPRDALRLLKESWYGADKSKSLRESRQPVFNYSVVPPPDFSRPPPNFKLRPLGRARTARRQAQFQYRAVY